MACVPAQVADKTSIQVEAVGSHAWNYMISPNSMHHHRKSNNGVGVVALTGRTTEQWERRQSTAVCACPHSPEKRASHSAHLAVVQVHFLTMTWAFGEASTIRGSVLIFQKSALLSPRGDTNLL